MVLFIFVLMQGISEIEGLLFFYVKIVWLGEHTFVNGEWSLDWWSAGEDLELREWGLGDFGLNFDMLDVGMGKEECCGLCVHNVYKRQNYKRIW